MKDFNWAILVLVGYLALGMWGMGRERRRLYYFIGVLAFLMWLFGFWEK